MSAPLVSIVMATYNRSNVLRYAIETVRWQSVDDWELIVVGDGCTDDTGEVVASFADPRIRFFNREENFGEQSAPNNDGVTISRGKFVAFLNHDDMWFPFHLESTLDALDNNAYDLVYALYLAVDPDGRPQVHNVAPTAGYAMNLSIPASTWLLPRPVIEAVGPWRPYTESYQVPSQEWLKRLFRGGHRIGHVERVTSVRISSSVRADSYRCRHVAEHEHYFQQMRRPEFLAEALTEVAVGLVRWNRYAVWGHLRQAIIGAARRLLPSVGLPTGAVANWLRYGRKGGAIDRVRAIRGLPRLERDK